MDSAQLLEKLVVARQELDDAVAHLEKVLGEIEVVPRAEKTVISEIVRAAFAKLNSAKTTLEDLQNLVADDSS
jgi:tRNA C32,U32 (ribose-2'-O)-methylase TrmJ